MKKLMIAASAIALAGVATAANVFDYKASVKYVDFKNYTYKSVAYDVKVVKSATLKGYLVTPIKCPCTVGVCAAGLDPAFLVVQKKAGTGDKAPHVLPANLLAKIWRAKATGTTLEAQGYLFAGEMDLGWSAGAAVANNSVAVPSTNYDFGDPTTFATEHLWSEWNEREPGSGIFVETWLTHAGFGKAGTSKSGGGCSKGSNSCLKSLKGSVVGGAFTCKPNDLGEAFLCQAWNVTDLNQLYLMDVVSGTWSIKENTKLGMTSLSAAEKAYLYGDILTAADAEKELSYLKTAGQKLDKNWDLMEVEETFAQKWMLYGQD